MCKAMKLQKSNFPKKEYELKLTEVFPVTATVEITENSSKGLDSSDDEFDQDSTHIAHRAPLPPPTSRESSNPVPAEYMLPPPTSRESLNPEPSEYMLPAIPDIVDHAVDQDTTAPEEHPLPVVEAEIHEPSTSLRPKRATRRPAYLGDYEC